jgi:hypothetical protein
MSDKPLPLRIKLALMKIHDMRMTAPSDDDLAERDERAVREEGFHSVPAFLEALFGEETYTGDFVAVLDALDMTPTRAAQEVKGEIVSKHTLLDKSLQRAIDSKKPWIWQSPSPNHAERYMLDPFLALQWFLKTERQHLVPAAVRDFSLSHKADSQTESDAVSGMTGLPGRPTKSWDLIEKECRARYSSGERHSKNAEWARALLTWLSANHPDAALPKPKTLENKLGGLLRVLRNESP